MLPIKLLAITVWTPTVIIHCVVKADQITWSLQSKDVLGKEQVTLIWCYTLTEESEVPMELHKKEI